MSEANCCPRCGTVIAADSPGGLCADCLLRLGLDQPEPLEQLQTQVSATGAFVPPEPQLLATRFPQLEVLELLGYGGMGAVYKARQKSLDRLVALKIIKPDSVHDLGFAERFEREAKALARLNHSHIVSVHDFGQSGGLYYFLMEFVDGTNLRRLLESGELTPEQAIEIIPQVCEALQFAHDEGIVHRDVKPENILVDKKGRVKIADFGLAKLLGLSLGDEHTLTGTHQVMGTPRYMAPEQMERAKTVDHRADIYSLGVVFYEMLTGELPLGSFEPPSKKAAVDARLDEVVLRSLAKEPERRYQHASDVKLDVESISGTLPAKAIRETGGSWPFHQESAWPDESTPWRTPPNKKRAPEKMVKAPALAMIAVGSIGCLLTMLLTAWLFSTQITSGDVFRPALLGPGFLCALALGLSGGAIIAGLKMQHLEQYELAVTFSFLAMLVPPLNLIGLPVGIWSLVVLLRREVREAFDTEARQSPPPAETSADWSPLVLGLVLILPFASLMAFGMWFSKSAWVLVALALPWFGLGIAGEATDKTPREKATTWLAVISFLLSLGLIALGIWIEHSAWPLFALGVGFCAAFLGMLAAGAVEAGGAAEASDEASPEKPVENGETPKASEEASPLEKLQWAAWWVGIVGAFRCWDLFSETIWSNWLETLQNFQFYDARAIALAVSGPIMLVGATRMYHARHYSLGLVATSLCFISGSFLPAIAGVWGLIVLCDPAVRLLFGIGGPESEPGEKK